MDYTKSPIFRLLNATQLDNFRRACTEAQLPPGKRFIEQGSVGDSLFLILDGKVQVSMKAGDEDREVIVLDPPAIIGEMEFLTGQPRTASVTTLGEVRLLELKFAELEARIADGDPGTLKVFYIISKVLAHRLAFMNQKFSEMADRPVRVEDLGEFQEKLFGEWSF
jgi:CRP-like cAMP-binding protein